MWNGSYDRKIDEYYPMTLTDWHHIEVTRNTTGFFSVYLNDTLIMEGGDTELDTSEVFAFSGDYGPMIDNIVVRDDIPITTPPPFDWLLVGVGVSAVVVVVVLVVIIKRR
jgi:hypothetical protein